MKLDQIKSLLLIIIILLLISCATIFKPEKQENELLLSENLEKWNTFRIDGIIEYNHKQFSFRKNISIRKKSNVIRLDIFDSGIFGLRPTPFISAYLDTLLLMRTPDSPDLIRISKEEFADDFKYLDIFLGLSTLFEHKSEIINSRKVIFDNGLEFLFNKNLCLGKIIDKSMNSNIIFFYNGELSDIVLYNKDKKILDIQVDKISFEVLEIKKLR